MINVLAKPRAIKRQWILWFLLGSGVAVALWLGCVLLFCCMVRWHNDQAADSARERFREAGFPLTVDEFQSWYEKQRRLEGRYTNEALIAIRAARISLSKSEAIYGDLPYPLLGLRKVEREKLRGPVAEAVLRDYASNNEPMLAMTTALVDSGPIRTDYRTLDTGFADVDFPWDFCPVLDPWFAKGLTAIHDRRVDHLEESVTGLLKVARYVRDEPHIDPQRHRLELVRTALDLLEEAFGNRDMQVSDAVLAEWDRFLEQQDIPNRAFLSCVAFPVKEHRAFDLRTRTRGNTPEDIEAHRRTMVWLLKMTAESEAKYSDFPQTFLLGQPIETLLAEPLFRVYDKWALNRLDEAAFLDYCRSTLRSLDAEMEGSRRSTTNGEDDFAWYCLYSRTLRGLTLLPYAFNRVNVPDSTEIAVELNDTLRREVAAGRLALAIERFKLQEGDCPDSLGRLVPRYLSQLPINHDFDDVKYETHGSGWQVIVHAKGHDPGADAEKESAPEPFSRYEGYTCAAFSVEPSPSVAPGT